MRVRLYQAGVRPIGQFVPLNDLPAFLSSDSGLRIGGSPSNSRRALCRLDVQDGVLVFESCDPVRRVTVNDIPAEKGSLRPGDALKFGDTAFVVWYEPAPHIAGAA